MGTEVSLVVAAPRPLLVARDGGGGREGCDEGAGERPSPADDDEGDDGHQTGGGRGDEGPSEHRPERRTGVRLVIDNRTDGVRLPADQEAQVYQIVQEALANVVKHAGAREARIVMERTTRSLKVSVEDDGCGGARRARTAVDCGEHYGLVFFEGGNLRFQRIDSAGTLQGPKVSVGTGQNNIPP